jgi:hypothetical protein
MRSLTSIEGGPAIVYPSTVSWGCWVIVISPATGITSKLSDAISAMPDDWVEKVSW